MLTVVADGRQAVESFVAAPESFDVIILDLMMPVMGGLAAAKKIRGLDFSIAKDIPIVAMTANAFKEDVQQCLEAGTNAHVAKPFDMAKLRQVFYRRLDDVPIKLQIKPYSDKKEEQNLSLWIFINDDTGGVQMKRFQRDKLIMDKLCYDFTAVYYIDLNTGSFTTLKLGKNTNAENLQMENEVELENFDLYARQYGEKYIAPEDRQEFLAWFNCRSLKEKLLGREVITYHYRSLPNQSGKKFFDTQVMKVHVDDEEFKVFMSFRHVDDILEPEVSTQEKLQRALAELELNNEEILSN